MDPVNYMQAKGVSKAYGEKLLFRELSLSIAQGQKLALIARNGTGKTTLLNIFAGLDEPDEGYCTYRNGLRISYLPQEPSFDPGLSISETLLWSDNEQTKAIRDYEEFISDASNTGDPLKEKELQTLIERMDAMRAWDYEQRVQQIISMLKIGNLKKTVANLSGGEMKRLALARVLIEEPDLLLLDEPTNHLDIAMIEWLEGFLSRQKLTLLMVTHDRYFLDTVCNEVVEIENGLVYNYKGNYAYYLEKKQERKMADQAQNEKAINLLRRETEWMRRSPPARTSKSKARIQAFHHLKEQTSIELEPSAGKIRMNMARMGKKILELQNVCKSFDSKKVLDIFSYIFKRGERVGVVGPNGTGKSTLLDIITQTLAPDNGKIITGETISFGYFRQEGIRLDGQKKVIEVITGIADRIRLDKDHWMSASQFLRYFQFPNHMHHDRVEKLSGGEKRRLYLLTILMRNPNFLILDEPTNDLDIETLNILEDFLLQFPGCLIIVSHDRYFLDRLADHLFVFSGAGTVTDFPGNYTYYREKQKQGGPSKKETVKKQRPAKQVLRTGREKLSYKEQQEFKALEEEIGRLEKEKAMLLDKMNASDMNPEEITRASERYQEVEFQLESRSDRWLELSERA